MGAKDVVATDRPSPCQATVREQPAEYLVEFDVSGFAQDELTLEATGRQITVRGDHPEPDEGGAELRLHEPQPLEESLRLPDDADPERISAVYDHGALEIHVRRRPFRSRSVPIERAYLASTGPQGC
jgi:HSP20 family molecular chaperone IbpA